MDGLLLAHCNFGTEYVCARLAKRLGVPVLLWGPLDERPEADGTRLRDTQCGLFATGKVLRRFQIPFTYLTNCRLTDPVFERGVKDFLTVCNIVKTFKNIRILQISTRPFDFWTTMCNEGELLEKFNVQLAPVPMTELTEEIKAVKQNEAQMSEMLDYIHSNMEIKIKDNEVENVAALAAAMKNLVKKYGCKAAAIQCWNALQTEIGIMPCAANAILNDEGIPVVCETDIHGAITALMVEAAGMGEDRGFFADWTIRHPDIENGELLQHCGPWPVSVAKEKPQLTYPLAFDHPGSLTAEAKHGDVTLCRFDGDNGEYSLLLGRAEGSVWEGAMAASHYKLDNLCAVVDRNRLQISGNTEDVMAHDDLHERFKSFGWHVIDVADGNDIDQLHEAFEEAKAVKGKPTMLIANTVKGKGSSIMENKANWHHKVPTDEEYTQIYVDLARTFEEARINGEREA